MLTRQDGGVPSAHEPGRREMGFYLFCHPWTCSAQSSARIHDSCSEAAEMDFATPESVGEITIEQEYHSYVAPGVVSARGTNTLKFWEVHHNLFS